MLDFDLYACNSLEKFFYREEIRFNCYHILVEIIYSPDIAVNFVPVCVYVWHKTIGCGSLQLSPLFCTSTVWSGNSNISLKVRLHKKWSFPLRISSVNVTKSAVYSLISHQFGSVVMQLTEWFSDCDLILTNLAWNLPLLKYIWIEITTIWSNIFFFKFYPGPKSFINQKAYLF